MAITRLGYRAILAPWRADDYRFAPVGPKTSATAAPEWSGVMARA